MISRKFTIEWEKLFKVNNSRNMSFWGVKKKKIENLSFPIKYGGIE